jgi:hypothetical protein
MKKTIFYGKTFYSILKNGPLEEFIGERPIVQRINDRGERSFASFINWSYFFKWYMSLREKDRIFSEVIPEGKQKFRLDIDAFLPEWDTHKERARKYIVEKLNFGTCKTIVYESVDPLGIKMSYHVVFPDLILESSSDCQSMLEEMKERCDLFHFFDEGVYKSLQCFRIEGSRKDTASHRYKYLIDKTCMS